MRGLNVIGEISILITSRAQTFHWAGYGLMLHIPKQCELIKVGIPVQFTLNPSRPITVELQHCATSSQTSRLSFARCSHYSLPYNFDFLQERDFRIHLRNFSFIAAVLFGDDVKYYMPVSTTWNRENLRRIHFLITKSFEAHATVCFHSIYFLNQCSFYSVDHCCYCIIITGSQKGVR